jgi:hypothetical protein
VAAAAREANVVLNFVDVRGLGSTFTETSASPIDPFAADRTSEDHRRPADPATLVAAGGFTREAETAGSADLARQTGGVAIRNTGELARNMIAAADESRAYYMLGFAAGKGRPPGKWRKLEVRARRGERVKARRGYTLQRPQLQADGPELPARSLAYAIGPSADKDATRAVVAVEFDAAARDSRRAVRQVEFAVGMRQRESGKLFEQSGRAPVEVRSGEASAWRSFASHFDLPPGTFDVQVIIRDPASAAMGTATAQLALPPAAGLRLSTPILTDQVVEDGAGRKPRAAMSAHREFRTGGTLYCEFEVFGAATSDATSLQDAEAGVQILDMSGNAVRNTAMTTIVPDAQRRVFRLVGMDVANLPAGRYELRVRVRDRVTGATVEHREPFTLKPAS